MTAELPSGDPKLVQIVDAALADTARRSGEWLVCKLGCTQCCIGVFAINQLDVARLQRGIADLQISDPPRAARIRQRALASIESLRPDFPGSPETGILEESVEVTERFEEFANDEPCPVLDPVTGACDLYSHRPILCRTFGPPMRTEDGNLAACELCYTHATTAQIAACELDPAIPALEQASDQAFNAAHHLHGETLVACALRAK